jgi:hypothetical protein
MADKPKNITNPIASSATAPTTAPIKPSAQIPATRTVGSVKVPTTKSDGPELSATTSSSLTTPKLSEDRGSVLSTVTKMDNMISPESMNLLIMVMNIITATLLSAALHQNHGYLLFVLLSGILAYILLNKMDNNSSRMALLGMGVCVYLGLQIVRMGTYQKMSLWDRIKNSSWELVYISILLYYVQYIWAYAHGA